MKQVAIFVTCSASIGFAAAPKGKRQQFGLGESLMGLAAEPLVAEQSVASGSFT